MDNIYNLKNINPLLTIRLHDIFSSNTLLLNQLLPFMLFCFFLSVAFYDFTNHSYQEHSK
jgi:hypothetical protein